MKKEMNRNSKATHAQKGGKASASAMPAAEDKAAGVHTPTNSASGRSYFEVARCVGDGDSGEFVFDEQQKRLLDVQGVAIDLLLKAYNSMIELAAVRLDCKLSNTRVTGVARELKELIKVMSVYDC